MRGAETASPRRRGPDGESFTFEKHVSKLKGGKGYADVWKRGFLAITADPDSLTDLPESLTPAS